MFVAFIYILFAAAMAGFAYWDRINRDNYDIDHCFDVIFQFSSESSSLSLLRFRYCSAI